jgi:hypothetical protein
MVFEPLSAEPLNCTPWSPCGRLGLETTTACKLSSPDPTTEPLICTPWSPCRKSGSKTPAALRLGFSEWSWQQSHWIALPGANVEDRAGELPLLSDLVLLSQQRRHWTALPEAHAGYWAWEPHCSQTLFCQDEPEAELNRALEACAGNQAPGLPLPKSLVPPMLTALLPYLPGAHSWKAGPSFPAAWMLDSPTLAAAVWLLEAHALTQVYPREPLLPCGNQMIQACWFCFPMRTLNMLLSARSLPSHRQVNLSLQNLQRMEVQHSIMSLTAREPLLLCQRARTPDCTQKRGKL